jgi:hypothetical protein
MNVVVISRIKCEFAAQLSPGGDQRCRCRIRNRTRIRSRSRNFLKSRIRIRYRIRNKSFRIHNPAHWDPEVKVCLVRLLSELNSLGWKLTSSADISAKYLTTKKGKRCTLIK